MTCWLDLAGDNFPSRKDALDGDLIGGKTIGLTAYNKQVLSG